MLLADVDALADELDSSNPLLEELTYTGRYAAVRVAATIAATTIPPQSVSDNFGLHIAMGPFDHQPRGRGIAQSTTEGISSFTAYYLPDHASAVRMLTHTTHT
ncbi:MAG: hypothetical protein WA988_17905 [Candidatus Nanopelagicales bacterium]